VIGTTLYGVYPFAVMITRKQGFRICLINDFFLRGQKIKLLRLMYQDHLLINIYLRIYLK
jgi:hypothetical protein